MGGRAGPAGHPPVENRDLGRAENVDVDVLPLEAHGWDLRRGHAPHGDVAHVLPHEADPGPLEHADVPGLTISHSHSLSSLCHR